MNSFQRKTESVISATKWSLWPNFISGRALSNLRTPTQPRYNKQERNDGWTFRSCSSVDLPPRSQQRRWRDGCFWNKTERIVTRGMDQCSDRGNQKEHCDLCCYAGGCYAAIYTLQRPNTCFINSCLQGLKIM